jgi:hypothetical protein
MQVNSQCNITPSSKLITITTILQASCKRYIRSSSHESREPLVDNENLELSAFSGKYKMGGKVWEPSNACRR